MEYLAKLLFLSITQSGMFYGRELVIVKSYDWVHGLGRRGNILGTR